MEIYSSHFIASCLLEKEDGYVVAGGSPFFVLETDLNGNTRWDKTFPVENASSDARSLIVTEDGGYLLAGNVERASDEKSVNLIKIDITGDV